MCVKSSEIWHLYIFILKALNSEIKLRRETVESVLKDNGACVNSIKVRRPACIQTSNTSNKCVSLYLSLVHLNVSLQDYETDLASYTSGLETLLNIPIKRTMLKSPTMDLNQEVMKPKWKCCFALKHWNKAVNIFVGKIRELVVGQFDYSWICEFKWCSI